MNICLWMLNFLSLCDWRETERESEQPRSVRTPCVCTGQQFSQERKGVSCLTLPSNCLARVDWFYFPSLASVAFATERPHLWYGSCS